MTLQRKRDHHRILTRLDTAVDGTGRVGLLGEVPTPTGSYPLRKIELGTGGKSRRALISAGIHGDEPAGVETVCAFLESGRYLPWLETWDLTLLPCLNPYGFEHDTRENHEDRDLNRLFKEEQPPLEVALARSVIDSSAYDLTLELHEDSESPGYYLYQKARLAHHAGLGYHVIDAVKDIMPINMDAEIDGTPSQSGVIDRLKDPEDMEWWPMALYSLDRGSKHCLTLETATRFPMETRIQAHLRALETALAGFPV